MISRQTKAAFHTKTYLTEHANFLYGCTFHLHGNGENVFPTKTFSLPNCYPKWKLYKTQQTKYSVTVEYTYCVFDRSE